MLSDFVESFPPEAPADLHWFFAHEVDACIVRNLERLGVQVVYDPNETVGFCGLLRGFEDGVLWREHRCSVDAKRSRHQERRWTTCPASAQWSPARRAA